MKAKKIHLKVIDTIRSILDTWESSNDIKSPSHYNLIQEQVMINLDDFFTPDYIEQLNDSLESLYYLVQKADITQLTED